MNADEIQLDVQICGETQRFRIASHYKLTLQRVLCSLGVGVIHTRKTTELRDTENDLLSRF